MSGGARGPAAARGLATLGGALVAILLLSGAGGALAFAQGAPNPVVGTVEAADARGVPMSAYANLPLDRGDALSVHKVIVSTCTDLLWTLHLGLLGFALGLLDWVLSFEWLEALLVPAEALGETIGRILPVSGWAPFAFAVAGLLGGAALLRGRIGAGSLDLLLSAVCFALSVSFLADPVGAIAGRGPEDPWSLRGAGRTGTGIAVAVLEESGAALGLPAAPSDAGIAGTVLGSAVMTSTVDRLVRAPAQEIAFGAELGGTCDEAFTAAMREGRSADEVRDAVRDCDSQAARYIEHPTMWQPLTVLLTLAGSLAILLLVLAMLVLLLASVLWGLWAGLRTALWVHVAILPGAARARLVRALLDGGVAIAAFVSALVLLSLGLSLVLSVLERISAQGTPMVVQMGFLASLSAVVAFGLWIVHARMREAGGALSRLLRPRERPERRLERSGRPVRAMPPASAGRAPAAGATGPALGGLAPPIAFPVGTGGTAAPEEPLLGRPRPPRPAPRDGVESPGGRYPGEGPPSAPDPAPSDLRAGPGRPVGPDPRPGADGAPAPVGAPGAVAGPSGAAGSSRTAREPGAAGAVPAPRAGGERAAGMLATAAAGVAAGALAASRSRGGAPGGERRGGAGGRYALRIAADGTGRIERRSGRRLGGRPEAPGRGTP
ncbi:MAG: hypothetical protein Q4E05_08985 [Pseudoclavibacter sp.]|nr:hypothetical protein [Pseudoclavibacter sp.]